MRNIIAASLLLLVISCSKDEDNFEDPTKTKYLVTVKTDWSASTHPQDFPANPHFSPFIGMVHNSESVLFEEGTLASAGIKVMAETGKTSPLDNEINALISNGTAQSLVIGGGIGVSPGSVTIELAIDSSFSLVSLVSMLAPSPDWFIAIENVDLYENGAFVEEVTVPITIYDAGTDAGITYTSADEVSMPQEKIYEITTGPTAAASIGSVTIKKVE